MPLNILTNYNIDVVPLQITFEEGDTYLDGLNLSLQEFRERLYKGKTLPRTSAPNPQTILKAFEKALRENEEVIYVGLSSKLSATYQTASMVRDMIGSGRIRLLDSLTASIGVGLLAVKAAQLAKSGLSLEGVMNKLTRWRDDLKTFCALDTLENVIKGGRIDPVQGLLGSMLNIKPTIRAIEGKIHVVARIRGRRKSLDNLIKIMIENSFNPSENMIGIAHMDCLGDVQYLIHEIEIAFGKVNTIISEMGSVMGVYGGRGALVLAF